MNVLRRMSILEEKNLKQIRTNPSSLIKCEEK
jgi:hypothetical protein